MASTVRVVCAMPYPLGRAPGQRYRWEQWEPYLRAHGIDVEYVCFSTDGIDDDRRSGRMLRAWAGVVMRYPPWSVQLTRAARSADIVVVYRNAAIAGPPLIELAIQNRGAKLLYDFDDAIYLPPESGDNPVRRALRADWRVGVLCRRAALVTVGNEHLKQFVSKLTEECEVWPTTISMAQYVPKPSTAGGTLTVGWTGSPSTLQYLRHALPLLRAAQEMEPFHLLVVGGNLDLEGVKGECVEWSADKEVDQIHRMDIGIMPLPDTPWTRGKCAAKALQYLGAAVPAIVSDVGVNRDVVLDGECGYVVDSESDWVNRLVELLRDEALRQRMGKAGREHVEENYSAEVWGPRIAKRLRDLAR